MTVIHFIAVSVGLYEQPIIWIDKVLHVMAGVAVAMLWFWFLQRREKFSDGISKIILVGSVIGFVLLVALLWEIFEFAYWKGVPEWANKFKFYSPTIVDVLSDMVANLIGGVIFSILAVKKKVVNV